MFVLSTLQNHTFDEPTNVFCNRQNTPNPVTARVFSYQLYEVFFPDFNDFTTCMYSDLSQHTGCLVFPLRGTPLVLITLPCLSLSPHQCWFDQPFFPGNLVD